MHLFSFLKRVLSKLIFFLPFFAPLNLIAGIPTVGVPPIHVVKNFNDDQSLVNSVDFHPRKNLICVTFTQNHQVVLYSVTKDKVIKFQTLENPKARLNLPQHAVFSKDGKTLVVASWNNETFTIYRAGARGFYSKKPSAIVHYPEALRGYRPHGIAFSSDGCYLAVAYGAGWENPQGVALFRIKGLQTSKASFTLTHLLATKEICEGIPKGIAFTPDDQAIAVTFADSNSIAIYKVDWANERYITPALQIFSGLDTGITRPEDIKFTPDGNFCAISNSEADSVTFYCFDRKGNYFVNETPAYTLGKHEGQLTFPHGLAFSSDGKFLCVTQFGGVAFSSDGTLQSWSTQRGDSFSVFEL